MAEAPKNPQDSGPVPPLPTLPTLPLTTRGSALYSQIAPITRSCTENLAAELRSRAPATLHATPDTIGSSVRDATAYLLTPGRFTPGPLAPDAERLGHYNAERLKQRALETGKLLSIGAALITAEMIPVALTAKAMLSVKTGSNINTSLNPDTQNMAVTAYHTVRNAIANPLDPIGSRISNAIANAAATVVGTPASASTVMRPTTPKL